MTDFSTSQTSQLGSALPTSPTPSNRPPAPDPHGRADAGMLVGGRYRLRSAVGHGGMGTVWRATDTQLGRDVAVKEVVPPPGIAPEDRDSMYERMLREARAAAVLSHPGVVQVYDVVTDGARPWIVMELLEARSLADMVLEDGPLGPRAVAKIGVTLLGALEVAHAAGVLHRDVKPANVLVCADGRCVLTDFGVARMPTDQQLTTPGMVLGSPHFISPERAMGASFGPPSDLFSLGVTLYCAVEGRPPFDKGEPIATMHSVVEDEPLPPQRAGVLTDVLYGLLEKDPQRRWDAQAARGALRDLLANQLASTTPQFPTDPYAVVPTQRQQQRPQQQPQRREIGGRAMLAPGESLTDRLHGAPDPARQDAYVAAPDAYGQLPDSYRGGPADDSTLAGNYRADNYDAGPVEPGRARSRNGSARTGGWSGSQLAGELTATATRAGAQAVAAVRRAPRTAAVAAAALLAVVVLTSVVWTVTGGDDSVDTASQPDQAPEPSGDPLGNEPPFPVQQYTDRGFVVNLPESWVEHDSSDIRVDFVDPDTPGALLRLLVEPSGAESESFVVNAAEPNISNNCPEQYERVGLSQVEVAGQEGTQLEYTCGSGDSGQHTLWLTTMHDGHAYSFFVRLPAGEFEERRVIFDELVRSFQFAD